MQWCSGGTFGVGKHRFGDTHRHVAEDGGTHKVAPLVTFDFDVPAVQEQLCSLVHAALDQTADSLLGLW